jgi:hypothetical protein
MRYVRPNLSPEQRDALVVLLDDHLKALGFDAPEFEMVYKIRLKLRDAKILNSHSSATEPLSCPPCNSKP